MWQESWRNGRRAVALGLVRLPEQATFWWTTTGINITRAATTSAGRSRKIALPERMCWNDF